ncbi:hypothetical protein [Leifsonia sp. Leaf264]|uniref:hypothetical protein n=1 Tax=Leifsonia sp. Leaf264 TaxID=1736314 RepID=UPI0006FD991E|nr:hypothetical protein [Leifsonia sp. Leaf264]KQO98593.1 hypothetical protein ASF30_11060 [Leifsonia sp. Leaf264]
MTTLAIVLMSVFAILIPIFIAYTAHGYLNDAERLRGKAPTCDNCGRRILWQDGTAGEPSDRLRDHTKACLA